jgi:hypothetical protein
MDGVQFVASRVGRRMCVPLIRSDTACDYRVGRIGLTRHMLAGPLPLSL